MEEIRKERRKGWGNRILCATFLVLCCGLPLAGIAALATGCADQAVSQEENRTLAGFPVVERPEDFLYFPEDFEAWYQDHLFLKSSLVQWKSSLEAMVFGELDSEKVILGTKKPWLFHRSNDGQPLETYKRTNRFTQEELQKIGENLDTLREELEDAGMRFVLMITPDKEQVYGTDYMPETIGVASGPTRTEQLIAYMKEAAPKVCIVYPRDVLESAKQFSGQAPNQEVESLYYESDTHWNQAGAFIGAQELIKAIAKKTGMSGKLPQPMEEKAFQWSGTVRGDLQKMVKLGRSYDSKEYIPVQPLQMEITDSVLDGNKEVIWEKSRSLAADCLPVSVYLTGDSFRWNLSGFLQEGAERTIISSRYYFDTEDLIVQEPDVFVYMIAERYLHELSVIPGYNTMALPVPE